MSSLPDAIESLGHWRDLGAAGSASVDGERSTLLLRLEAAAGDNAAARRLALQLADGVDRSRLGEHEVLEDLAAEWASAVLVATGGEPPLLFRLVGAVAAAPAPARAAAPSRPRPAAVAPPAAEDTGFARDLDVAAQVAALVAAAQSGVPFCEECARAAAQAGR
ncbi:MAG: hypothetical protein KGL43_18875 [Burkholderiales bacterium]|nr:hypothetical protein [Burkholderiales bacterium]MDE2455657.1 hypothetical protein [Burkholderiales bacterium]